MVEKNQRITIAYTLKDPDGIVIDQAPHNNPLQYVHGYGQLLSGLENALDGRQIGEHFFLELSAQDAYGEYDDDLLMWVDREELAHLEDLSIGMEVEMYSEDSSEMAEDDEEEETESDALDFVPEDDDNTSIPFLVKEMNQEQILLDGNHPLAGVNLFLEVSILNIEDATFEEIEEQMLENLECQNPLDEEFGDEFDEQP